MAGKGWPSRDALLKHMGRRLKELRGSITQEDLAPLASLSVRQLQNLEAGLGSGAIDAWRKVANALDLSIAEFLVSPSRAAEGTLSYPRKDKRLASEHQLQLLRALARRLDERTMDALLDIVAKLAGKS